MKITDKTHKVGSYITERRSEHSVMRIGIVKTKHGIVTAMSWAGVGVNAGAESSWFCFVWDGRFYSRDVQGKAYTDRGLITVARRFAASVATPPKTGKRTKHWRVTDVII